MILTIPKCKLFHLIAKKNPQRIIPQRLPIDPIWWEQSLMVNNPTFFAKQSNHMLMALLGPLKPVPFEVISKMWQVQPLYVNMHFFIFLIVKCDIKHVMSKRESDLVMTISSVPVKLAWTMIFLRDNQLSKFWCTQPSLM